MIEQAGPDKMAIPGYNVRKAAQVTAFFALKEGGRINVLKLAKLLYLAEREYISRYDSPMLFDLLVSMPQGPVTSKTLNYINGLEIERGVWDEFVRGREDYNISTARDNVSIEQLDELSDADIDVLEGTWKAFGSMDRYQIRDYTHENCPEWDDPNGSSFLIPYETLFRVLGKKDPKEMVRQINEVRALDVSLAKAR